MIIKLVEVFENKKYTQESKKYAMREVFVNPDHVVCLRSELGRIEKQVLRG